jgi:hypothetical protein
VNNTVAASLFTRTVKINLSLSLIKNHGMKKFGGRGGIAPPFLSSVLDGGKWSAHATTAGWMDLRASMNVME